MTGPVVIPGTRAVVCIDCGAVSDATGETCPACTSTGTLANVHKIMSWMPWVPPRAKEKGDEKP